MCPHGGVCQSNLGTLIGPDLLKAPVNLLPVLLPLQCLTEGPHQVSCMRYKRVVKINHAQELLERLDSERARKRCNHLHLGREWPDTLRRDMVAKEINCSKTKLTLGRVHN